MVDMKKKRITKEMFVDNCKICKKEFTGYTEREVTSNMERHKGSKGCVKK